MNKLIILLFFMLLQYKHIKKYILKVSNSDSIVVELQNNNQISLLPIDNDNIFNKSNETRLVDVKISNKTKGNLTFITFKNNCFYGEKYIIEDSESIYSSIVDSFKTKNSIVKANGIISSRIPVPITFENKKVKSYNYRINYYTENKERNAISIYFTITNDKLEIREVQNKNLSKLK